MAVYDHAFLISSPLQAVVVNALLAGPNAPPLTKTIVFVADERLLPLFDNVACQPLKDTRLTDRVNIVENVTVIDQLLTTPVDLWISDLLWPMNNAGYTHLSKHGRLRAVNFFDEGFVLYWQERLTLFTLAREWLKCRVHAFRLGLPFTCPAREPFYDNANNGIVHALHPDFLSRPERVRALDIDLNHIANLAKLFLAEQVSMGTPSQRIAKNSALFLAQPYYRISGGSKFQRLVAGLTEELQRLGHEKLYVKMHPSEGEEAYNRYYRDFGFEIAYPHAEAPIEVLMQTLPTSCTLVSFNSSALLNAQLFGFKGRSLAYGLNWVADQYPMHRNMLELTSRLLQRAGVNVVTHQPVALSR